MEHHPGTTPDGATVERLAHDDDWRARFPGARLERTLRGGGLYSAEALAAALTAAQDPVVAAYAAQLTGRCRTKGCKP